jgi:hypothetical protein
MDNGKAYIQEKGLVWTNVPNIQGAGSNPAMEYVVMLTPTLVLIDKNGIIQHRFVPENKLEKYYTGSAQVKHSLSVLVNIHICLGYRFSKYVPEGKTPFDKLV